MFKKQNTLMFCSVQDPGILKSSSLSVAEIDDHKLVPEHSPLKGTYSGVRQVNCSHRRELIVLTSTYLKIAIVNLLSR